MELTTSQLLDQIDNLETGVIQEPNNLLLHKKLIRLLHKRIQTLEDNESLMIETLQTERSSVKDQKETINTLLNRNKVLRESNIKLQHELEEATTYQLSIDHTKETKNKNENGFFNNEKNKNRETRKMMNKTWGLVEKLDEKATSIEKLTRMQNIPLFERETSSVTKTTRKASSLRPQRNENNKKSITKTIRSPNSSTDRLKLTRLERQVPHLENEIAQKDREITRLERIVNQLKTDAEDNEDLISELLPWLRRCYSKLAPNGKIPINLSPIEIAQCKRLINKLIEDFLFDNDLQEIDPQLPEYKRMEKDVLNTILRMQKTNGLEIAKELVGWDQDQFDYLYASDIDEIDDEGDYGYGNDNELGEGENENENENENEEEEEEEEQTFTELYQTGLIRNIINEMDDNSQAKERALELEQMLKEKLKKLMQNNKMQKSRFMDLVKKLIFEKLRIEKEFQEKLKSLTSELEKADQEIKEIQDDSIDVDFLDLDDGDDFENDLNDNYNERRVLWENF
ncbi:a-type inclusion protein [Anaeramoeba flamelloides]|uniref:A-type inclusion protein n=1 Tax=Anaeramoeba flamelloides TaxID=1746091 RepID=A0ABQ8XIZ9_9EUKA|nr:a-type inclusion protein [Anaeramoeba flamelloides]